MYEGKTLPVCCNSEKVEIMATFAQAIEAANAILTGDNAVHSVEIEFITSAGHKMRAVWNGLKFLSIVKID